MNSAAKTTGAIIIGIVAIIAVILAIKAHFAWQDSCEARGGHVASHTNWGGRDSSHSDTTYYCLTDDGGIIDIR